MRLVLLLLVALSLMAPAAAQDATNATNTTGNGTPADGNATPTNETPAGNDTPAAPAGPLEIILEGVQEGSAVYYRFPGETQRNPTLNVQPGQVVRFTLRIASGVHNLNVNDEQKTPVIGEGEASFEWTAPTTPGRVEYWCDPHKSAGMRGTIQVGAAPGGGGGGEQGEISGDTIDLGEYSAACEGRVAPAAAAEGIVGLPTLQDYIDACTRTEGDAEPPRAKHVADYIIPLSWLLIGLGIVGVVWVHRYYRP